MTVKNLTCCFQLSITLTDGLNSNVAKIDQKIKEEIQKIENQYDKSDDNDDPDEYYEILSVSYTIDRNYICYLTILYKEMVVGG